MANPWVCLKYGGTSVATQRSWTAILRRVREVLPTNRVWLVVSALSQVRRRTQQGASAQRARARCSHNHE
jgi:aspartokinase